MSEDEPSHPIDPKTQRVLFKEVADVWAAGVVAGAVVGGVARPPVLAWFEAAVDDADGVGASGDVGDVEVHCRGFPAGSAPDQGGTVGPPGDVSTRGALLIFAVTGSAPSAQATPTHRRKD